MNIVEIVKNKLIDYSEQSKTKDGYDFWNEHIKFVFKHAGDLARKYNADIEVCELAALLHDIAMPAENGPREEHHIYGAQMAQEILSELNYTQNKIDLIKKCVLHHRGSKDEVRETIEEQIVADADVMAHFDNIPSLFSLAYNELKLSVSEGAEYVKNKLLRDYKKLSPQSKELLKDRFDTIMSVLFLDNSN